jgi:N-acetylneuraminic acid mutarotase
VVAGDVYVTGGEDEDDDLLSSMEKYSPSSNTWSIVPSLPEQRSEHAAVAVGTAMYVLGGYAVVDATILETASVRKLDSVRNIWSVVAPMPEPRYDFTACVVGSDIYVFGGFCREHSGRGHASVFKYDTQIDEWRTLAPMPVGDHGISAIELGGVIYIVGGGNTSCGLMSYDPVSGVWSNLASLTHECYHGAFFVLGGCLYAAGGQDSESKVQRYDVTTNAWTEVADMLEGRYGFGAVTVGSTGPVEEQDLFDSLITKATM